MIFKDFVDVIKCTVRTDNTLNKQGQSKHARTINAALYCRIRLRSTCSIFQLYNQMKKFLKKS